MDNLKESFRNSSIEDIKESSKQAGKKSESHDPHSSIHIPVQIFEAVYNALKLLVVLAAASLFFLGEITSSQVASLLSGPDIAVILVSRGVPVAFLLGGFLYLRLLRTDTEFVQMMNKHLRVKDEKIDEETNKQILISYLLWNRTLSHNTTLPVLAAFTLVQAFLSDIFDRGIDYSVILMEEIVEENKSFLEAMGSIFEKETRRRHSKD